MNTNSNLSKPATENQDDDIDVLAMMLTVLRGWKTIIFFAAIGLLIGLLYSRYENTIYSSDALIQIESSGGGVSSLGSNFSDLVASEASLAETEAELIKSRMVLQPVVDMLHLSVRLTDPNIDTIDKVQSNSVYTQENTTEGVKLNTSDGQASISQFDVSINNLNKSFTLVKTANGFNLSDGFDDFKGQLNTPHRFQGSEGIVEITVESLPKDGHPIQIRKQSIQNTTDAIKGSLEVGELGKQTGIIKLSMTGPNQDQITRILSQIIFSYIDQNNSRGSEETTRTIEFMETQIPTLKKKLEDAEAAFNEFRTEYGTIDVDQEASILVAENARIDSQLSELKLKKADLTTYYTEEHPLVIQIEDQINELQNRRSEIDNRVEELPEVQRQFLQLSEDVGINREIYLNLLKNYQQLQIARAGQVGFARIIDLPINTYRAIAPKKSLIVFLATLTGLLLGIMAVLLKNMLRNTVKDPERLEAKTGIPVIATIPRSPSLYRISKSNQSLDRLLANIDHTGLSYEAIKSLRTHLMFGMPSEGKSGQRAKVILITGESPGLGKSFIAGNLAEVFGQLDKKVLIIDADMRLGELHKLFNISYENGLSDYFSQANDGLKPSNNNLSDIVHPTKMEHIDFIPRGKAPYNPSTLLASDKFSNLMSQLNEHYDYIIIDSPPVLAASDAIIISKAADKVLMVARYDKSVEGQVVYAAKQLNRSNVQVDGIVLNDVQQGITSRYSYHYNYAYGNDK